MSMRDKQDGEAPQDGDVASDPFRQMFGLKGYYYRICVIRLRSHQCWSGMLVGQVVLDMFCDTRTAVRTFEEHCGGSFKETDHLVLRLTLKSFCDNN